MATLYENFIVCDHSTAGAIVVTAWIGQTFTPSIPHKISSVKLELYKVGAPGNVTVSIRATNSSGMPVGPDLCSGTIAAAAIATTPGAWYTCTFSSTANLIAGQKYAIVCRIASGAFPTDYIAWWTASAGGYSGGQNVQSSDSGTTWSNGPFANGDFMFEDWGDAITGFPSKVGVVA